MTPVTPGLAASITTGHARAWLRVSLLSHRSNVCCNSLPSSGSDVPPSRSVQPVHRQSLTPRPGSISRGSPNRAPQPPTQTAGGKQAAVQPPLQRATGPRCTPTAAGGSTTGSSSRSGRSSGSSAGSSTGGGGGKPRLSLPVVVEGHNDRIAVQRAVDAKVYVLNSATKADSSLVLKELQQLLEQHGGLVILTDSDVAGRQARNLLETRFPGCYHAFVPAPLATSASNKGWHEAGNVGVEHAPPAAIQAALKKARQGSAQRAEFSREMLVQMGLVAPHHLPATGSAGFAARRALVCAYLGIGNCDGKQLLRQLNTYGFQLADLKEAMLWARGQLQQQEGGQQEQQQQQQQQEGGRQQQKEQREGEPPQPRQQRGSAR